MSAFKNVALLGATGNLGSHILAQLNKAGFNVTAIQRAESTNIAKGAANSIKVPLNSVAELTKAFKGQDVVISATPNPALKTEKAWIDASITAGVKRIIPSEYSTNLETEPSRKLPIVFDKLETRTYVEKLASEGKIEWTSVNCGPFLVPFIFLSGWMGPNPKAGTTSLHDGGEKVVCTSTLDRIGEAIAAALKPEHAEATKNKPLYTYSVATTEKKITDIVAKITGQRFEVQNVNTEQVTKDTFAAYEQGDKSQMMGFYTPFVFGEDYGGDFRSQSWNEKLGLKNMTDGELEEMLRGWLTTES